ncbi:E3 ubiquitin ISG15 ligase TRIM25-like protein [Labeo rohita]|uniref:E3 ubiquitin ISG15 ligase TRIM25-like protein n=1 Tax=Labeo rohita TaxID=84645 RepID=A0A498MVG8_LABRO|nr:E3 ubiquitin ISG15 ligase TRIM25-like protein [Labeo rohita]
MNSAGRESIKSARHAASSASERARTRSKGASKKLAGSAVPCDRCTEPKAAVKTCLVCMASFCETHLKPHNMQEKLRSHELIAPTSDLSQKICPEHKYLQEFFCRSCQMYVCWLCTSNQHKGHESVSTQAERNEKQRSSETVQDEADTVLSELQESVQRMLEMLQDVMVSTAQEKLNEAQDVVTKLEAEVKQLKKKDGELKEIINCQDNIYFLKTYHSLCCPLEGGDLGAVTVNPEATFDPVRSVVVQLREKVEEMLHNTTVFTVADRNGQKTGGIMKLFSGKGTRGTRAQGPPPLPSVSTRGSVNTRTQAVRNSEPRVNRGVTSSPRPARSPREESNDKIENQTSQRRQSTQSRSTRDEEQVNGEAQSPSQQRSNAVDRQQPARQSDRWSLSSLLPRNRKKRQDTVKEATPTIQEAGSVRPRSLSRASAWGEPTEVNPGLFLDSPTDSPLVNPAFPTLREINIDSIQAPEPRSRDEFLESTLQQTSQPYPDLPQRFDGWTQVLCLQPLSSDRCYWEVEWRGRGSSLGVVSSSMSRKGADSGAGLGYNSQSWSLELSDMCCAAMHANQKMEIPVIYSPRVGVFLDRTAGTLTFYTVDDELVPLHTFQGSFPSSLYAAFGVGCGVGVGLDFAMGQFSSTSDSIKICPL